MPTKDLKVENTTTLNGFGSLQAKEYYDRILEKELTEKSDLSQFTDKDTHPRNNGKSFTSRRLTRITPPTAPLEEGIMPEPNKFGMKEYTGKMAPWGDYVEYTDEVDLYAIDPLVQEMTELLADSAKELLNKRRYEAMISSKNHYFAGVTNISDSDTLTSLRNRVTAFNLGELPTIAAFFSRNQVRPINDAYVAIIPPEVTASLTSLAKSDSNFTFVELSAKGNYEAIYKGEIGKILRFRFVESNSITIGDDGIAKCILLGKYMNKLPIKERYVGSGKPRMIVKGLGSAGTNDALDQKGTIGYKIDAIGFMPTADVACMVYECKPAINFASFPETSETGLIKKYEVGQSAPTDVNANKTFVNANKSVDETVSE